MSQPAPRSLVISRAMITIREALPIDAMGPEERRDIQIAVSMAYDEGVAAGRFEQEHERCQHRRLGDRAQCVERPHGPNLGHTFVVEVSR